MIFVTQHSPSVHQYKELSKSEKTLTRSSSPPPINAETTLEEVVLKKTSFLGDRTQPSPQSRHNFAKTPPPHKRCRNISNARPWRTILRIVSAKAGKLTKHTHFSISHGFHETQAPLTKCIATTDRTQNAAQNRSMPPNRFPAKPRTDPLRRDVDVATIAHKTR